MVSFAIPGIWESNRDRLRGHDSKFAVYLLVSVRTISNSGHIQLDFSIIGPYQPVRRGGLDEAVSGYQQPIWSVQDPLISGETDPAPGYYLSNTKTTERLYLRFGEDQESVDKTARPRNFSQITA